MNAGGLETVQGDAGPIARISGVRTSASWLGPLASSNA